MDHNSPPPLQQLRQLQNEKANEKALHTFRRSLEICACRRGEKVASQISHINTWSTDGRGACHKTHSLKLFSQACRAINFSCTPAFPLLLLPLLLLVKKPCARVVCGNFGNPLLKRTCARRRQRRLLFHSICILSEG